MSSQIKVGVRYIVVGESYDGTLRKGDRVILAEDDGALYNHTAAGFLPKEDVAGAMEGAVLEIDKEWVEHRKQKAAETLAKLEGL